MTLDLFDNQSNEPQPISLPGADLVFWPQFYSLDEAELLYESLLEKTQWQEKVIRMYGRNVLVPRLSSWYADKRKDYTYSGALHNPLPWTSELLALKRAIESRTGAQFNSVLCNLYRNEKDSVSWHSDDEPELGLKPVIASLSFGETRTFQLRRKDDHKQKFAIELSSGSCLLMAGSTQQMWQHQIAKTSKTLKPRINLTFRLIS